MEKKALNGIFEFIKVEPMKDSLDTTKTFTLWQDDDRHLIFKDMNDEVFWQTTQLRNMSSRVVEDGYAWFWLETKSGRIYTIRQVIDIKAVEEIIDTAANKFEAMMDYIKSMRIRFEKEHQKAEAEIRKMTDDWKKYAEEWKKFHIDETEYTQKDFDEAGV